MKKKRLGKRAFALIVLLLVLTVPAAGCTVPGIEKDSGRCPEGHPLTYVESKLSSCMKEGNLEYWYCEACNRYFADANGEKPVDEAELKTCEMGHGGLF